MRVILHIALGACGLGVAVADAAAQTPGWTVAGIVRDTAGHPVADVELRVEGRPDRALSGSTGAFFLEVDRDSVVLVARRMGFRPYAMAVVRPARGTRAEVVVRLVASPVPLDPVTAAGRPEAFESRLNGFYERAQSRSGHFIGPERLSRLSNQRFTDLLREVPGVRFGMVGRGTQERSIRLRGATCAPTVFLDGLPASAGEYQLDAIDFVHGGRDRGLPRVGHDSRGVHRAGRKRALRSDRDLVKAGAAEVIRNRRARHR